MTQRDRVLAKARSYDGCCQADFLLPNVCDDGPPITRVAARLYDLDLAGFSFECIGWRCKTKVFRLVSEPDDVESEAGGGPDIETSTVPPGAASSLALSAEGPPPRFIGASVKPIAEESQGSLFPVPAVPHYQDAA